jgi:hypothetical protein
MSVLITLSFKPISGKGGNGYKVNVKITQGYGIEIGLRAAIVGFILVSVNYKRRQ